MKDYRRGNFRAHKTRPYPETHPRYYRYAVQALVTTATGTELWGTIESFDYASNARQQVRNLHAARCIRVDLCGYGLRYREERADELDRVRPFVKPPKRR